MSFFRYPGGKNKLKNAISSHLNLYGFKEGLEYREPFFGGGSVGVQFLGDNPNFKNVWINDKDPGIACLWTSVLAFPEKLKKHIQEFQPSVESFDLFKSELLNKNNVPLKTDQIVLMGFKKLAIHQISYSGLGTKSGGPLGGRSQSSKYKIDCRWSPDYICKKIDKLSDQFSKINFRCNSCTSVDFSRLISSEKDAFIYLDPPYYNKGNELYQCGFTADDHKRLSDALKITPHPWLLSYDDCKEIRELYDWAEMDVVSVNYTITGNKDKDSGKVKSRNKLELLIYSKNHKEIIDASRNVLS